MIVNEASKVVRMTLQVVASPRVIILMTRVAPMIVINLTTLEVSFKLLENIYSKGITHDNCHLRLPYFYRTGHRAAASVV